MIIKILYLYGSYGGYDDSKDMEDFLDKDNCCYESVETLEGIREIEFEVTDSIDKENLHYICWARVYQRIPTDDTDYWNYWYYIQKDNKWIKP